MATVHAKKISTKFMLLLGSHYHCVKVLTDSETVRGIGLWEFFGALRELMLSSTCDKSDKNSLRIIFKSNAHFQTLTKTPIKFQKDRHLTAGGVAHIRYLLF